MTPQQTKREFGPEAAARRQRKAERAERTKAVALDALDVGRGGQPVRDPFDSGIELGLRRASAAVELGRPLRGSEVRKLKRQFRQERVGEQPAGQSAGKRKASVYDWLSSLTPDQRDDYQQGEKFARFSPEAQAYFLRQRALLEEAEDEAEYLLQRDREQQALEDDEGRVFNWETLDYEDEEPEAADEPEPWGAGLTLDQQIALRDIEAAETYAELESTYDFSEEEDE
jgi:hypothetical protein